VLVFSLDFISAVVDFMGWLLNDNSTKALRKRKKSMRVMAGYMGRSSLLNDAIEDRSAGR
jgi:hypothetical protein